MPDPRAAPVVPLHRHAAAGAPLEERDDETLMLLAAADHRRAFDVLARRHLGPLTGYCGKFLGTLKGGEEVALDALVEAWTRRRRYVRGRFKVFVFTIARNRCLNRLRGERRRGAWSRPADEVREGAEGGDRPDQLDALLEGERLRRTREALLTLAPKLREALLLRFDQGLTYAEIARVVRRPEVTVRSRVFHAIRRLRAALREEEAP
ncbi:MAG TPA: RNA polymerase sigma factor [Anaeromyxobacter sp.]|nr:RNA polymerase sigma factor [Anaeromyxobacter sp.]